MVYAQYLYYYEHVHKYFSGLSTAQLTVGARALLSTIKSGSWWGNSSVHGLEPDDTYVVWCDCATIVSYCES